MAKPILTKYNPVELLQSNSTYQPLNGFFFDRLKNFEDLIQYPQKYQNSDTLVLQFQTEAAATFDVKLVSDSNSYNLSTSALTPPISYTGTNIFYKSSLELTSVAEGIYYVRVKITTDKIYYFVSEPICIKATHENTILFKYTHDLNQYDTLFQTSTTPNYFYLRVEGGVKTSQYEQGSTDEIFIDQNYNSIQLDGETYNIYNFLFGSGLGLPYWMAEKLNRIMILYEFYIDNKRFKKNQGTKFERIEIIDENYPLCNYKIELLPEQSDVLEVGEGDEPVTTTDFGSFELTISNAIYSSRKVLIEVMPTISNLELLVNWGDSNSQTYNISPGFTYGTPLSHTYANDGTYTVTIKIVGDTLDKIKGIGCGNYPATYGFAMKTYTIADMSNLIYMDLRFAGSTHQTAFNITGTPTAVGWLYLDEDDTRNDIITLNIANTITFSNADPIWNTQKLTITLAKNLDLNATNLFNKIADCKEISISYCKNIDATIGAGNPNLDKLRIYNCNNVTNVSLNAALVNISQYYIRDNTTPLSEANVNAVLIHADTYSTKVGTIDLTGGAAPSGAGATAKTSLQGKGWTVITS